ncbi:MAG TPA: S1/P1 nuclease [Bacteroidales bacterium]|nr:S1/P1 nuclease [Bacteroidales bacterium]HPS18273.1 S1/P1 nuclease [Bacteroidales bacterium]
MYKKFILIYSLCLAFSDICFGWGKEAHQIIIEIAKSKIDKPIRDSVDKYLNGMSWEEASIWMDEIKDKNKYDYMSEWHHLHMDKNSIYNSNINKGDNIVNQLKNAISKLKKKYKLSNEDINFYLKILFHLMGDIHQPLHVGYDSDKGGKDVKVKFKGYPDDLHEVWDSDIIRYKKLSFNDYQKTLAGIPNWYLKQIPKVNIVGCMYQTRKLLDDVYNYSHNKLSDAYIDKSYDIIKNQILLAGLRLSIVLNEIFGK